MSDQAFMDKLDTLHKIKMKTDSLDTISGLLKQEVSTLNQEESNMKEYKSELDMLLAEKLHHVEILRQIHSDINMMETVIKQGQQAMSGSERKSAELYHEYTPLISQVNEMRREVDLEPFQDEELDKLNFTPATRNSKLKASKRSTSSLDGTSRDEGASSSKSRMTSKQPLNNADEETGNFIHESKATIPPMKQCGSCHQFIHRNAPICPLCKAKSRSRNPKKAKK